MKTWIEGVLASTIIIMSLCLFQCAFQGDKVKAIIENHGVSMGGKSKWEDLKSYRKTSARKNGLTLEVLCRMPNKVSLHFLKDSINLYKKYNGKHGHILRNGKYTSMRKGEAVEMAEEAEYYSELIFALDRGYKVTLEGEEEVEGVLCNKLLVEKSEADKQVYWLDKSTALIRQTGEYSEDTAHEGIYYKTLLEDYRSVDGYMFPYKQTLIPSDRDPITSITSGIEVNIPNLSIDDFTYQPNNTRGLISYWKDRYKEEQLKSFTFVQETIQFEEDGSKDTSIWYEAIAYPDLFRMDFGDKAELNRNLYRNDSIYVLRKGELVHKGTQIQEFMILEGATYYSPVDSTLQKLTKTGLNTDHFYKTMNNGRDTYVIGALPDDSSSPQVWLDAEWRNSVKRISKTRDGRILKVIYDDFKSIDGHMIESWLEFYIDDKLIQTERYNNIEVNPTLDPAIFDVEQFHNSYWY